jgi:filamentous hemagglutinin
VLDTVPLAGAASALVAPEVIKGIDPTGAQLTSGQTALVTAISTLVAGVAADALGQNAQGAMSAAENEALNNATRHPEAAKNGGLLSSFWDAVSSAGSYVGDQLASAGRGAVNMGNQFLGLMNANNGQTPPSDPNPLVQASNGNPLATGGAVVTPPTVACMPGAGCVVTPPLVSPGSPNNAPSNAILSSGNSGNDGGSATGQGSARNTAVNQAELDALAANGVKFAPQNVVATGTTPSGQIVFLETGSSSAGLQHIIEEHGAEFANMGVSPA